MFICVIAKGSQKEFMVNVNEIVTIHQTTIGDVQITTSGRSEGDNDVFSVTDSYDSIKSKIKFVTGGNIL